MTEHNTADRDQGDWGADPELRALLCGGDPVHSLPQQSPADVERLVAAAISADRAASSREPAGPRTESRRSRFPLMVAAAAVLVAGVGGWAAFGPSDGAVPTAVKAPATTSTAPAPAAPAPVAPVPSSVQALTVIKAPSERPFRCGVPSVDVLKLQQLAFEGTVSAIDGAAITLSTTKVYAGDVAESVQIQAPSAEMSQLLSAVSFESGKTYLVSATDGQVTLCGFSAEATPDLQALYEQAFAG